VTNDIRIAVCIEPKLRIGNAVCAFLLPHYTCSSEPAQANHAVAQSWWTGWTQRWSDWDWGRW
jgi:hypothetical protein